MAVSTCQVEARAFQIFWKCFAGELLAKSQIDAKRPVKDPPDFEFDSAQKHIGIEHMRLENRANGQLAPLHELAIKARILDRIRKLLKTDWRGMPPVSMSIQFVSCRDIKKKDNDEDAVARRAKSFAVRSACDNGNQIFPVAAGFESFVGDADLPALVLLEQV